MNRVKQIQQYIESHAGQKDIMIIAIDGNCTAGKTTLAAKIETLYDCNIFHMDDFFLRPEQRTPARFLEPGGNVDYERFQRDVLLPLQSGEAFSYQPFNCSSFTLSPTVTVQPKRLNIIEGTYSLHPFFNDPYDLKVFMSIDADLQHQRILERPLFLHDRFFQEWIPMEDRYFKEFRIADKCDLVF